MPVKPKNRNKEKSVVDNMKLKKIAKAKKKKPKPKKKGYA